VRIKSTNARQYKLEFWPEMMEWFVKHLRRLEETFAPEFPVCDS
jgi:hypothetical protein